MNFRKKIDEIYEKIKDEWIDKNPKIKLYLSNIFANLKELFCKSLHTLLNTTYSKEKVTKGHINRCVENYINGDIKFNETVLKIFC